MEIDKALFKAITGNEPAEATRDYPAVIEYYDSGVQLVGNFIPAAGASVALRPPMHPAAFARAMKKVDPKLGVAELYVLYWRQILPEHILHEESKGMFFSVKWKKKFINEELRKQGIDPKISWGALKC